MVLRQNLRRPESFINCRSIVTNLKVVYARHRERRPVVMGDGDAKAAPRQRTSHDIGEYLIVVEDWEG